MHTTTNKSAKVRKYAKHKMCLNLFIKCVWIFCFELFGFYWCAVGLRKSSDLDPSDLGRLKFWWHIYIVNYSDIVNPSWLAFYGTVWCLGGMWSRSLGFRGVCSFLVFLHPRLLGCGVISFFRLEGLGEKTPRPDACIVDRPCSQCSSPHVRSTGTSSLRSEHPVYGLGMIGVIIAPLVLPIEAVAMKIPWQELRIPLITLVRSNWTALKHCIITSRWSP